MYRGNPTLRLMDSSGSSVAPTVAAYANSAQIAIQKADRLEAGSIRSVIRSHVPAACYIISAEIAL